MYVHISFRIMILRSSIQQRVHLCLFDAVKHGKMFYIYNLSNVEFCPDYGDVLLYVCSAENYTPIKVQLTINCWNIAIWAHRLPVRSFIYDTATDTHISRCVCSGSLNKPEEAAVLELSNHFQAQIPLALCRVLLVVQVSIVRFFLTQFCLPMANHICNFSAYSPVLCPLYR